MGKPLSTDLRSRLITAVAGGMSRRAAAERFGVAAASAVRWVHAHNATGAVRAKPQGGDKRCHHDGPEAEKGGFACCRADVRQQQPVLQHATTEHDAFRGRHQRDRRGELTEVAADDAVGHVALGQSGEIGLPATLDRETARKNMTAGLVAAGLATGIFALTFVAALFYIAQG